MCANTRQSATACENAVTVVFSPILPDPLSAGARLPAPSLALPCQLARQQLTLAREVVPDPRQTSGDGLDAGGEFADQLSWFSHAEEAI